MSDTLTTDDYDEELTVHIDNISIMTTTVGLWTSITILLLCILL